MSERVALDVSRVVADVSALPTYSFDHHSLMWWGTWGIILIEGTVFALAVATYFYLRRRVGNWPPGVDFPRVTWGTVNLAIVLASLVPNVWAKRAAESRDLANARKWTWVLLAFALVALIVRIVEFRSLNCRWDTNAYGSIVWTLLGLHTTHLLTDLVDTLVLAALMFTRHADNRRRLGDVQDNAMYWNFVVVTWLPVYLCIYCLPRW